MNLRRTCHENAMLSGWSGGKIQPQTTVIHAR